MADNDDFDIDIYGDEELEQPRTNQQSGAQNATNGEKQDQKMDETEDNEEALKQQLFASESQQGNGTPSGPNGQQHNGQNGDNYDKTRDQYGEGEDDRPVDPGATQAVIVSEIQWWVNDDDVRGWARFCNTEDELRDITFSEHKVNGKCKGQVYVDFHSVQAATAFYHLIQSDKSPNAAKPASRKYPTEYINPNGNPFKTLPKDGPGRAAAANTPANTNAGATRGIASSSPYERQAGFQRGGGFRGRGFRGGYNNNFRGGGGFQGGGGFRGGFRGRVGGFNQGGMQGGNNMMNMPNMMGMAGMMGMPNMMNMGLNPMQGGGFNPGFFQSQGQQGGQGGDNPHGQKRMRQDG